MQIEVKNKKQDFFAVITDVDIKNISNTNFVKIKQTLETYGVVVLKNQNINDNQQIEFSRKFGDLEKALEHDKLEGIQDEITRISNVDASQLTANSTFNSNKSS